MLGHIRAISNLTKSVVQMAILILIFAFLKKQGVFLIRHFEKSVKVPAALILKAVRLTSPLKRPIIYITMIASSGITNVVI